MLGGASGRFAAARRRSSSPAVQFAAGHAQLLASGAGSGLVASSIHGNGCSIGHDDRIPLTPTGEEPEDDVDCTMIGSEGEDGASPDTLGVLRNSLHLATSGSTGGGTNTYTINSGTVAGTALGGTGSASRRTSLTVPTPMRDYQHLGSARARRASRSAAASRSPAAAASVFASLAGQTRLSIEGPPPGAMQRGRRRAVEISDHKAVVLLHSKLKGMKLEDVA